jgi:hypothetical protein
MRYMVANATTYKIDTAWLFAGGYSAGAGISNALVYNSQAETNQFYPSIVDELGNMNNSGNALTNTFTIKGIYNNWGGVSSDFFDANEAVPTVSFHGGADDVVPVDSAIDVSCFTTSHYIFGSHALYEKLTSAGICSDLTVDLNGGHGVYQDGGGELMRTNRATCFFKSLFCNSCVNYASTDSLTPDCANMTQGIIENSRKENLFSVYPNPANNLLNISFSEDQNLKQQIQILNSIGVLVNEVLVTSSTQINVSELANGLYLVRLKDDARQTEIFTKQ